MSFYFSNINSKLTIFFPFFRFPIADLRPLHDPERIKWWEKNVRPDYLMFTLTNMTLVFSLPTTIDIIAHEIDAFYYVSNRVNFKRLLRKH